MVAVQRLISSLLVCSLLSKSILHYVNADDVEALCNVCFGDPNAFMSNRDVSINLYFIGFPDDYAPCGDVYDAGLDSLFFETECAAIQANTTIAAVCGCIQAQTPTTPTPPVPVPVPVPVPAPVPVPVPVPIPGAPIPVPVPTPVAVPVPVVPVVPVPVAAIISPTRAPSARGNIKSSIRVPTSMRQLVAIEQ